MDQLLRRRAVRKQLRCLPLPGSDPLKHHWVFIWRWGFSFYKKVQRKVANYPTNLKCQFPRKRQSRNVISNHVRTPARLVLICRCRRSWSNEWKLFFFNFPLLFLIMTQWLLIIFHIFFFWLKSHILYNVHFLKRKLLFLICFPTFSKDSIF